MLYIFLHSRRKGTSSIKQSEHGKRPRTMKAMEPYSQTIDDVAEKDTVMMAEMAPI
jgi:hypothetical protein